MAKKKIKKRSKKTVTIEEKPRFDKRPKAGKKKARKRKSGPQSKELSQTKKAIRGRERNLVKPAWQRRPRPWEPGGAEAYRLTITPEEFVSRCCMLWAHGVSNKGISYSLGVNFRDFSHWITELDRPWLFNIDLWGEKQQVKCKCTFGDLCQRMRETFEPVYLTKLKEIITDAEEQGDLKTASSNLKWLMEKIMPRKYGKHETLNIHNIPIAIITASEDGDPEGELKVKDI